MTNSPQEQVFASGKSLFLWWVLEQRRCEISACWCCTINNISKISKTPKYKHHSEDCWSVILFIYIFSVPWKQEFAVRRLDVCVFSMRAACSPLKPLTWLPSFCQKMAGGGFPVVPHWKVTLLPCVAIWSWGFMAIWGGTGRGEDPLKASFWCGTPNAFWIPYSSVTNITMQKHSITNQSPVLKIFQSKSAEDFNWLECPL